MTALDILKAHGRMEAAHMAELTGWPLECIYTDLVQCEALGLARVVVHKNPGGMPYGEWEAVRQSVTATEPA